MTTQRPIGSVRFIDGSERTVYLDADGRQYVLDGDEAVFGVWILTDDCPD